MADKNVKEGRVMSCSEVAKLMGISESGVNVLELSALAKLRKNPEMRMLFKSLSKERISNNIGTSL